MYRVYMFEDMLEKHENFISIINAANNLANQRNNRIENIMFEAGFGNNAHQARLNAFTPERIKNALQDDKGLYFIDIEIKRASINEPNPEDFLSEYCTGNDIIFGKVVRCYNNILENPDNASGILQEVLKKHSLAIHIMLYCILHNKQFHVVSTAVRTGILDSLERVFKSINYTLINKARFPYYKLDKGFSDEITKWAEVILQMIDPIELIKRETCFWFKENIDVRWRSFEEHGLPHNFADISEDRRSHMIPEYLKFIQIVFPWAKEQWVSSNENIIAFHQCLKTVVGTPAQWMGSTHDKPLSLAGAYLVFLIALSLKSHCSLSDYLVDDWRCFCTGDPRLPIPLPFMPSQNKECADRTIRSLYEFFLQIILLQDGTGFGLDGFFPPRPDHPYFGIKLKWPDKDLKGLANGIRTEIAEAFGSTDYQLKLPGGKTVGTFFRFLVASQAGDLGFGARGTIRLDNDPNENADKKGWLWIGQ